MPKKIRKNETLKELGEEEVLQRLEKYVSPNQIKDDTAEINIPKGKLLINSDLLVEEIHFSNLTTESKDVGWRAITANLSDLAASGVEEIYGITVGLVAPPETSWEWVEGVYEGMQKALKKFGGALLGGDCSKGSKKMLAITAFGSLGPLRLHRAKAKAGDWIVVSGPHGLSRLGLAILLKDPKISSTPISKSLKEKAILAHQRPNPPLKALKKLIECKPNEIPWRAAGTDSSDGLLQAIYGLCKESNCEAILDKQKLPRPEGWPSGEIWDEWCSKGGEDFQLVLSLPEEWARDWIKSNKNNVKIGEMRKGKPKLLWKKGEKEIKKIFEFSHF